ncbi:cell division protein ZipA [Glaesserella parasuis]|nr:cell division protein ZipA [Glaesserella parasuis]MDP0236444.1 cell division protein ZipA [Glaesserella parasuis]
METHILFFILAGLLIAVLIGYSIWSARREKSRIFSNTFSTRPPSSPINNEITADIPTTLNPQGVVAQQPFNTETPADFIQSQQEVENSVKNIRISLQTQEISQPLYQESMPESQSEAYQQNQIQEQSVQVEQVETIEQTTEHNIITLYVVAPEGVQFQGNAIVQNLEMLGFHFGEYQIFHRHLDNPASPVLFSVANMMQPGVFDLARMEQFSTVGLVFFMHLPSVGNDLANLKLMIRTVESFAQSVGGFVLDEQHQIFNDESRQNYLLRVAN